MNIPKTLGEALAQSPLLFPLQFDPTGNIVQVVRLLESDYASASFLDNRILGNGTQTAAVPWSDLNEAATGLPKRCHFIFHISHAGSTLLSRLMGATPECFSLREPGLLRLLGQGTYPDRLETCMALWSRTFHPQQTAMIKATSFVSEIASTLLSAVPNSRALLMFVPPATFLPALLDGSMTDIHSQAESRLHRLQRKQRLVGCTLAELSPGERVAMSWLSEMESLQAVAAHFPDRTQWLDFDQFLLEPHLHLQNSLAHFGIQADVAALLSGPIMQRYAKKPEVKYDTAFRSNLLAASQSKYAEEIAKGLAWLEKA